MCFPASIQVVIDPYIEATQSAFLGLNVSLNTATLWGRRVHQVAVSENVLFALSDTGEVFTWGGNSYWWVGYAVL
jgi:alpha-tubulin suppressor-like RCC1 family protein